ncbi:MAG: hypothetical protein IT304_09970 [Dehalococcoidia bacterium]|nr:hypothetical protein [Dehalococcoidia bacterium]
MARYKAQLGLPPDSAVMAAVERTPLKFYWFLQHGYSPHIWQILFHGMSERFRHLAAGRRGGKTLSAAWDVLYYCQHPEQFYADFHPGKAWNSVPLWVWALAENYKIGRPSYLTFLAVVKQAGLVAGVDYKLHKGEKYIEFYRDGEIIALLEFKTADDPESLRGAGLDILWIDEASFVRNDSAWNAVRPALSDREGIVITTTTPAPGGHNWFWELGFSLTSVADAAHGSVEYRSIDNPYFSEDEWLYAKRTMHPIIFAREYEASFDAMAGRELSGEWLHYYTVGDVPPGSDDVRLPRTKDGKLPLELFMAVDPAISLSDDADRFVMALIGFDKIGGLAYLLDLYAARIPFPEQVRMIQSWYVKHRPKFVGVESNAYQAALSQMLSSLPGMMPVVPILSKGKKAERILRMAPLFQLGKVRIHRSHVDFIEEWIGYDSTLKNTHDDTLDAVEIALRCAGALLPDEPERKLPSWLRDDMPMGSVEDLARREIADLGTPESRDFDPEMGADW